MSSGLEPQVTVDFAWRKTGRDMHLVYFGVPVPAAQDTSLSDFALGFFWEFPLSHENLKYNPLDFTSDLVVLIKLKTGEKYQDNPCRIRMWAMIVNLPKNGGNDTTREEILRRKNEEARKAVYEGM